MSVCTKHIPGDCPGCDAGVTHSRAEHFGAFAGYTPEQHAERVLLERAIVATVSKFFRGEINWDAVITTGRALVAFEDNYGRPTR